MKVSVVILTKNEEHNIVDCLESLRDIDEILLIDDVSSDRTVEVAKKVKNGKIKILTRALNGDFSSQRNYGLEKAKNTWVLFLDADERATPALLAEMKAAIGTNYEAFSIKRRDVMWGKEIKYGESGNISFIRLGRKDTGKWRGDVHESWVITGNVGKLNNELRHYPHQTLREFLKEVSTYSTMRAKELQRLRAKVTVLDIVLYPKGKFFVNYFLKLGVLDGIPGLLIATMMSFHSFLVRTKLWLAQQK